MHSMKAFVAGLLLVAALSQVCTAKYSGLPASPQASPPAPAGPAVTLCPNSSIKKQFTAKVAVLVIGTAKKPKVVSADYAQVIQRSIQKRLARYNQKYKLQLKYSVSQKTQGSVVQGAQKWFYYDVTFVVGDCGLYKGPLVAQLRADIQPSAPWIKLVRVLDYPVKA